MNEFDKGIGNNSQDLARILTNVLLRRFTEENEATGEEKT